MDSAGRPSYRDLTPEQRKQLCNGVGSDWMPRWLRKLLTLLSGWFFNEASWCHHDFGYAVGHTEAHRLECDQKFLAAMLRDAGRGGLVRYVIAVPLSLLFYVMVRVFGRFSFAYGYKFTKIEV